MLKMTINTREFLPRASQQGQLAPAEWVYKDPTSPLGDDTITLMTKYAIGNSPVDKSNLTMKQAVTVVSDGVNVRPYQPATLRVECIFDRNTPKADKTAYLNDLVKVLADPQVIASIVDAQPTL